MATHRHLHALATLGFAVASVCATLAAVGDPSHPAGPSSSQYDEHWSGTYQIDRTRSDDADRIADDATRSLPPADHDRVRESLMRRLGAPDFIALERTGRTVTMASSLAPRMTFDIDDVAHSETSPGGYPITVRSAFSGGSLVVTTTGHRGTDYTVTFEPIDAGETLRVTRRLDDESLPRPVESQSYYRRTSSEPRWTVFERPVEPPPPAAGVVVPDRTVVVGRLNTPLGSRTSHQGDRFSLTVDEPAQFRGATIDGVVSRLGSNRPGRTDLVFDFDRIRLRDGRSGDFEGTLSQVRSPEGDSIAIDTEGVARVGDDRTDAAVQRGTVGAAFGAIIGAIAGGGKGAAIGAAVGASAGAGSVYAEGRDLYLPPGTVVTLIARAPRYPR